MHTIRHRRRIIALIVTLTLTGAAWLTLAHAQEAKDDPNLAADLVIGGMTRQKMKELIARDPVDNPMSPQLAKLPYAERWIETMRISRPDSESFQVTHVGTDRKVDAARYVVSEMKLPDDTRMYLVATWDDDIRAYRQWFLGPDDRFTGAIGVMTPNGKAIAWMTAPDDPSKERTVGVSAIGETLVTGRSISMEGTKATFWYDSVSRDLPTQQ